MAEQRYVCRRVDDGHPVVPCDGRGRIALIGVDPANIDRVAGLQGCSIRHLQATCRHSQIRRGQHLGGSDIVGPAAGRHGLDHLAVAVGGDINLEQAGAADAGRPCEGQRSGHARTGRKRRTGACRNRVRQQLDDGAGLEVLDRNLFAERRRHVGVAGVR